MQRRYIPNNLRKVGDELAEKCRTAALVDNMHSGNRMRGIRRISVGDSSAVVENSIGAGFSRISQQ